MTPPPEEPTVDLWSYAAYFSAKLLNQFCTERAVYLDCIQLNSFIKSLNKEEFVTGLASFLNEPKVIELQDEMQKRHEAHINLCALYALCAYIQEIIKSRLCIKLRPSLSETIEEIGGVDNIAEIEFKLINNSSATITTPDLFGTVMSSLKATTDMDTREIDTITNQSQVYTKEYSQIIFVDYLSRFFQDYFKIKRRVNSFITTTEQRIICYLLYKFGFSSYPVQESRFRQLFRNRCKITKHWFNMSPFLSLMDPEIDIDINIPVGILSYSEWKDGKINPLTCETPSGAEPLLTTMRFPSQFDRTFIIAEQLCNLYNNLLGL